MIKCSFCGNISKKGLKKCPNCSAEIKYEEKYFIIAEETEAEKIKKADEQLKLQIAMRTLSDIGIKVSSKKEKSLSKKNSSDNFIKEYLEKLENSDEVDKDEIREKLKEIQYRNQKESEIDFLNRINENKSEIIKDRKEELNASKRILVYRFMIYFFPFLYFYIKKKYVDTGLISDRHSIKILRKAYTAGMLNFIIAIVSFVIFMFVVRTVLIPYQQKIRNLGFIFDIVKNFIIF